MNALLVLFCFVVLFEFQILLNLNIHFITPTSNETIQYNHINMHKALLTGSV
ncbi:hypothetical protein GLYMA_06G156650v4 [Glycine max]|nr:hypothetical protein GLYMA_06G156650v4 [Glycine max]KAH1126098.1 hypothetical protein GYH30_015230 [Glycine max]